MKFVAWLLLLSIMVAPVALCERDFLEVVRLLEKLSSEGVDVSLQVEEVNRALDLYRSNRTAEADILVAQTLQRLRELEQQLPAHRFRKWMHVGATVATLMSVPPLFYYFFPRIYALAWAYTRREWRVRKSGSRR